MDDVTSEGEWIYPLPEMIDMSGTTYHGSQKQAWNSDKIKTWKVPLSKVKNIAYCFGKCPNFHTCETELPSLNPFASSAYTIAHFDASGWKKFKCDFSHIILAY